MEFAIIAAGEGARLRNEGVDVPKPLLPLMGKPMIYRLIRLLANQGAKTVHVAIHSRSPALKAYLSNTDFGIPVQVYVKDTPSSLHTLHVLLEANPGWESCCVTTTDSVFTEADFAAYLSRFKSQAPIDAYMGLTAFVDDESPLFVGMNEDHSISHFTDEDLFFGDYVSGGVYILGKRALALVKKSIDNGNARMRNYQRDLLSADLSVRGYLFGKIVDVDHLKDRDLAEEYLHEIGEQPDKGVE